MGLPNDSPRGAAVAVQRRPRVRAPDRARRDPAAHALRPAAPPRHDRRRGAPAPARHRRDARRRRSSADEQADHRRRELSEEAPMSIFDFLRGEFIDVIHWTDDTRDTIVWRFEREGHAIKYGAKLTVREGQAAVFIHEGQLADIFGPGLYELETNNLPILTTLQHWDHGFQSPFLSEIYFVNTRRFTDLKWGTRNPITCRDPDFGMVRLRAYGTYTMRVTDPAQVPHRDRRHRRRVHHRGDRVPDPQHHRHPLQPDHRHQRHPGARHGGEHHRPRQARPRAHRADDRRVRPRAAGLLHREHLAARRGRDGARQAHRDRRRRRPLAATPSSAPPRR